MVVVLSVMEVMLVHAAARGGPVAVVLGAMSVVSSAQEWYPAIIYRITDETTLTLTVSPLLTRF